jgi:hypothetical protein
MSQRGCSEHRERPPDGARVPPRGKTRAGLPRDRLWTKILLLAASAVVGLALAEFVVRVFASVTHRVPLVVGDARTGWALPPNLRNEIKVGDGGRFATSTDQEGHRLTRPAGERYTDSCPTIILVGDSFVQGQGVGDSESLAWILDRETGRNVVNLGVLGFATDQELISLADYLAAHPTLHVQDIVVFVCDNDFQEIQVNYHYLARSKPLFRIGNGGLEMGNYGQGVSDWLMDRSYLYWLVNSKWVFTSGKVFPEPAGGRDLVAACLAAMRDLAVRRGARFHVFAHHFLQKREPFADSLWTEFLRRVRATDITPRLRASKGLGMLGYDGGHWSAAGHRLVAQIVKDDLEAAAP